MKLLNLIAFATLLSMTLASGCWKERIPRLGTLANSCPDGKEISMMMCYDPCPAGYVGAGTMCWLGFASTMRGIGTFLTCSSSDKDY